MPKPGKKSWRAPNYDEHDIRGGGDNHRRVNFKHGGRGAKFERNTKNFSDSIRAHLLDEDIDMGGSSRGANVRNVRNFSNKRAGRTYPHSGDTRVMMNGRNAGNQGKPCRRLQEGPINWYRITLPFGNKYDKQFILKTLLEKLEPMPFIPLTWSVNGNMCTFYVDDFKVAEKILSLDREIQLPDGFKMLIRVSNGCPTVDLNSEQKDTIKLTMAKRYNPATKALDLTKFHIDPDLQHMFCALFKPVILLTVIDIIAENIPELEALNLFDNRIHMLGHLKKIKEKLPNLKILHMGNNKIRDVLQLDALIGLPVVDLVLDGNPLCDNFKDQETYISEVRKRFPKVVKLDGIDLPPPISFDISTEVALPVAQQTYLCNPEGQGVIAQFLEQYFQFMDSDDRSPLQAAYHENATFSITSGYPYGQHQKNSAWLNWYNTDNRNLKRVTDHERRHKLLRQGQQAIISFLKDMPTTKHDIMNFTVDLNLCTPQMLLLTVTGIYKELRTGHKLPPIRHFFRTLVIVPAGSGFCIANEEVHFTNATDEQAKLAFKTPKPVVAAPSVPDVADVMSELSVDVGTKKQMVETLSQQSLMNLEWSEKCLAESNWNFQNAMFAFGQAHKEGKIPPEAFVK